MVNIYSRLFFILFALIISTVAQALHTIDKQSNFMEIGTLETYKWLYSTHLDKDNWLWVSADNTIMRTNGSTTEYFDDKTTNAIVLDSIVSLIFTDLQGNLMVDTFGGLFRFDSAQQKFYKVLEGVPKGEGYPTGYANAYFVDSNNREWIGNISALVRYDSNNFEVESFSPWVNEVNEDTDSRGAMSPAILDIEEDSTGNLWLATARNGLIRFNPQTKAYKLLRTFKGDTPYIKRVNAIVPFGEHEFMLATPDGIVIFDTLSEQFRPFPENRPVLDPVIDITFDPETHEYWAAGDNLIQISADNKTRRYDLGVKPDDLTWIDKKTLLVTNKAGKMFVTAPQLNKVEFFTFNDNNISSASRTHDGVYLGMNNKFVHFDGKSNTYTEYKLKENSCEIQSVINMDEDLVLVGCHRLMLYSLKDKIYKSLPLTILDNFPTDSEITSGVRIDDDRVWFAVNNYGVFEYNRRTHAIRNLDAINESMYLKNYSWIGLAASTGKAIVATSTRGLSFIDTQSDKVIARLDPNEKNYPVSDGLMSNIVSNDNETLITHLQSFVSRVNWSENTLEQKKMPFRGPVYCGSHQNIDFFYGQDKVLYGMSANKVQVSLAGNQGLTVDSRFKGCFTNDEAVFLFSTKGLYKYPLNKTVQNATIDLQLLNFYINYEPVAFDSGILSDEINKTDTIALDYNQRTFQLELGATSFVPSDDSYFQFKLTGYDGDWITSSNHFATYTQIPSGTYSFKARAVRDNVVSDERSIIITIATPWWRSKPSFALYISLIIALIWFVRNREQLEKRKLEKLVASRTKEIADINAARQSLYQNLSHELNSPLTGINALTQHVDKRSAEKIQFLTGRMQQLIRQIIDISNWTSTKNIEKVPVNLVDIVNGIIDLYQAQFEARNIDFTCQLEAEAIIECNPDAIEKIVSNLLSNAIKYSEEGAKISVIMEVADDKVTTHIVDNGMGISEADQKRLFNRFFRGSNSQGIVGSGIGLALVAAAVESNGGEITVDSAPGQGSTFSVIFSLFNLPAAIQLEPRTVFNAFEAGAVLDNDDEGIKPTDNAPDKKHTVLIVEDTLYILNYLIDILGDKYQILTATNGKEALAKTKQHFPDIILSDIMMPEMDGFTLLKRVKSDHLLSHIPFVLLTAKGDSESIQKGYALSANDYIAKPFVEEDLRARVANLLGLVDKLKRHYGLGAPVVIDDQLIEKINHFLDQNYPDNTLSIPDICSAIAITERNLQRKLKALLSVTPVEYLRNYRLEKAKVMISEMSSLNIQELADRSGFSSSSYFSACFKKHFGLTPRQYFKSSF